MTIKHLFLALLFISEISHAQHIELGTVNWMRNYDEAVENARKTDKAILILFQEVPGCSTCKNYGKNILSQPLIVDAIETYFVPLTIFNNKGGADRKILDQFEEPSWNNPVIRLVDENGNNIQTRLSSDYSASGLIDYMIKSFPKRNIEIPEFLIHLSESLSVNQHKVELVDFSMYCFWSGEAHLGKANGVVSTKPGFKNGKEVVRVEYNSDQISINELSKYARRASCKEVKKPGEFRADKDPQYYLKHSNYKYLALTAHQRTKINSRLANKKTCEAMLSPSQLKFLNMVVRAKRQTQEVLYDQDFDIAWKKMTIALKKLNQ